MTENRHYSKVALFMIRTIAPSLTWPGKQISSYQILYCFNNFEGYTMEVTIKMQALFSKRNRGSSKGNVLMILSEKGGF
jgi:hypothetical protein